MKKRKAEEPTEALPASIRIEFSNLPPESRRKLDEAMRGWAEWHAFKYPPGYVPPDVSSGSLGFAPDQMALEGDNTCFAWEERPAPPAKSGAQTLWFNIAFEKVGDVPRYDRITNDQLHFSARKRPVDTLLLSSDEAAGVGKPVKRLRSANRCFNCGSYGHSMRECWKEHNAELVEESRKEHAEGREAAGASYRSAAKRYYLQGSAGAATGRKAAEQAPGEFDGLQPGQLSVELRQALGLGELAPPPWLHRMRELGPPPGYMEAVPAAPALAPLPDDQQGPGASSADTTDAADGLAGEQLPGAAAAAAKAAGHEAEDAAAAGAPVEDFISLEGIQPAGEAGEAADGEQATVQMECRVQFPGVNAPVPEGADEQAWAAAPQVQQQQVSTYAGTPGNRAMPPVQHWHQQQHGGSVERSSSDGGRGAAWRPLLGLHPPRLSASEGGLATAGDRLQEQLTPQSPAPGRSTPDLYSPTPPLPQPPAQQQPYSRIGQQQQQTWHSHQQMYHQQQAYPPPPPQQVAAPPLPPSDDVYSVSRADPGHLLAYSQVAAGGTGSHAGYQQQWAQQQQPVYQVQAGAYAPQSPPPQHQGQETSYQQLAQVYGGYGGGSGGASGGWQQRQEQVREQQEQVQREQQEQQRRLWQGSGRY